MAAIDDMTDGLAELESSFGATFNWAGTDYPCSGGEEVGGKKLDIGGFKLNADVRLVVRLAVFGGNPSPLEKQKITYTSIPGDTPRGLRIETITTFSNAILIFDCSDPNQGV